MSHAVPELISVKEIAEKTGLSVRQIQRLAAKSGDNKMPGVKRGADGYRNVYERSPLLEEWIEAQRKRSKGRQKAVTEAHNRGTPTFGTAINRIVVLAGKLEREGVFDSMDPGALIDLLQDFQPAIEAWAKIAERVNLEALERGDYLKAVTPALAAIAKIPGKALR